MSYIYYFAGYGRVVKHDDYEESPGYKLKQALENLENIVCGGDVGDDEFHEHPFIHSEYEGDTWVGERFGDLRLLGTTSLDMLRELRPPPEMEERVRAYIDTLPAAVRDDPALSPLGCWLIQVSS